MSRNGLYRAPALVPLSRDHHDALVHALWLRRRAGQTPAALAFLDFLRSDLEGHMEDEEYVVLPPADAVDPSGTTRIRDEHARLREQAAGLQAAVSAGAALGPAMEELAALLHDHVRYEERVFFMGLQAALSADALASMGTALEARRAARGIADACRIAPR